MHICNLVFNLLLLSGVLAEEKHSAICINEVLCSKFSMCTGISHAIQELQFSIFRELKF